MRELFFERDESYMEEASIIPIINNKKRVASVRFVPNLNLAGEPSYVNEGGNMGLIRIKDGRFKDRLVVMYENEFYPSQNRGEFISEDDAYDLCLSRGKNVVIKRLNIHPTDEEE